MKSRAAAALVCALLFTSPLLASSVKAPDAADESLLDRFVDGTFDPSLKPTQERMKALADDIRSRSTFVPGRSGDFGEIAVYENDGTLVPGGSGGISNSDAIVVRFFQDHPDQYGQVFLNFNFPMEPEAGFAFEANIKNDVLGIGLGLFDFGAYYGTQNLYSYLNMNDLGEFPNFSFYNAILGQESLHRFAAFVEIPANGCTSQGFFLLGRDCAHWNFYCHSQGSTMEGNNWTEGPPGTFTSSNAFTTYSEVDEYLLGLRLPTAVTMPLFVITSPTNCFQNGTPKTCPGLARSPGNNWQVDGTKTAYTMQDIINAQGTARVPDANSAPHTFRVAFIMVCPQGQWPPAAADLAKLDGFRTQWETFFASETNGLGTMETRLYLPGEPPHPAFYATPTFSIPNIPIQFTDDSRNSPATWSWDFGDGGTSTVPSPSHSYTTAGTYDVTLTVANGNGSESRTKTGYITIKARPPQSEFTADVTIGQAPLAVNFTDQTTWNPSSWLWSFGDGTTSTVQSPSHVFTTANRAYTVTLTTTNAYGSNTRGRTNYIMTATPIVTEGFETGGAGWTHGANAGTDDWQLGPPMGLGGDPSAAHGGTNVYGTDLSSNGLYQNNQDEWLKSPSYDGSSATYAALSFWRWLQVEDAFYDQASVYVGTTQYFQNPVGSGSDQFLDQSWTETAADITKDAAGNPAFQLEFTLKSDAGLTFGGWNIDDVTIYATPAPLYTSGSRILAGPGFGAANPNQTTVFSATGQPLMTWNAYGAGSMGTNVAQGDVDGDTYGEVLTGPGPGFTLGPQVRGFNAWDGSAIGKINYFAYGTLRYGTNVASGNIDGDDWDEIVTGPGSGAVFGPHVRGWNFDGSSIASMGKVSYFAYGTLKYGCIVASGQVDTETTYKEIVTGAGPGAVFASHMRGWNFDNASVTALPGFSIFVFAGSQYGVNVTTGDYAGSAGRAETVAGKGPAPSNDASVRAYSYSGSALTQLTGSDLLAYPSLYGVRVAGGKLSGTRSHLVAGPGPSSTAASALKGYTYKTSSPQSWLPDPSVDFTAFATSYGTNPAVGDAE